MTTRQIAISLISHGHAELLPSLVAALLQCDEVGGVVVTLNIPETLALPHDDRLVVVRNDSPKGFGANHNAALRAIDADGGCDYFCPINPDVTLVGNPFPLLLAQLQSSRASLAVPLVMTPEGRVEDSLRRFPTLRMLLSKARGGDDGRYAVQPGHESFYPEWAAGMFMLFRAEDFRAIGGFDERYFLYYEDVDICARLWKSGRKIVACPQVRVVHDARRTSRRNLRYMRWHGLSMLRYFWKHWGLLPR